jgi:hypothetical protein
VVERSWYGVARLATRRTQSRYLGHTTTELSTGDLKGSAMYTVVRGYSGRGASELFDLMEQRETDVTSLIRGVPGFVSYAAFRGDNGGGMTVTVCQDKAGVDESSRRAAEWIEENLTTPHDPPVITEGSTFLQF